MLCSSSGSNSITCSRSLRNSTRLADASFPAGQDMEKLAVVNSFAAVDRACRRRSIEHTPGDDQMLRNAVSLIVAQRANWLARSNKKVVGGKFRRRNDQQHSQNAPQQSDRGGRASGVGNVGFEHVADAPHRDDRRGLVGCGKFGAAAGSPAHRCCDRNCPARRTRGKLDQPFPADHALGLANEGTEQIELCTREIHESTPGERSSRRA